MGRGSRSHPPSRTSRTSRIIHTPLNTPSGHRNRSAHLFFIPIHIKPQGQKPPAAHGTPPITSHNIFINPQNLRLINRIFCVLFAANPLLPPNFTAIKFTAIKFKRLFEVYKPTSQQVYEFLGTNEMGHHISFSDKPIWRTFFPLNKWRCISATFSAKRWGLYLSGLRFTS